MAAPKRQTPKLGGALGWLPHTCHRPGDHAPSGVWGTGMWVLPEEPSPGTAGRERACAWTWQDGEKPLGRRGAGSIEQQRGLPSARHTVRAMRSRQLPRQWLSIAIQSFKASPAPPQQSVIHEDMAAHIREDATTAAATASPRAGQLLACAPSQWLCPGTTGHSVFGWAWCTRRLRPSTVLLNMDFAFTSPISTRD